MWEQSRTRVRALMNRSSYRGPTPASPTGNSTPETPQDPKASSNEPPKDPKVPTDSKLLYDTRHCLSRFDQLCNIEETPLTDPRVLDMRKEILDAMPRVYALAEERNSLRPEARKVRSFAEDFLRRFPDVDIDALRPNVPAETTTTELASGGSSHRSASNAPSQSHSPSTETSHRKHGPLRGHGLCGNIDALNKSPSLEQRAASIKPAQRKVLEAIHELLSDDIERVPVSAHPPILRAPAAKSPEQLLQMRGSAGAHGFPPGMH